MTPRTIRENGYVEGFNGKLRDEALHREIFYALKEAEVLSEQYRQAYNRIRPHNSLGYRLQAPQAVTISEFVSELVGLTYRLVVQRLGGRSIALS